MDGAENTAKVNDQGVLGTLGGGGDATGCCGELGLSAIEKWSKRRHILPDLVCASTRNVVGEKLVIAAGFLRAERVAKTTPGNKFKLLQKN